MFTSVNDIDRMFGAMDLLRNRMDRIFNHFDRPFLSTSGYSYATHSPRTNLLEKGDHFEVQVEVPGMEKDNLNIKIQGNYLEINGKRIADTPDGYSMHRNERGTDTFSRSFTLPADVKAEKVDAALKDGILYLSLPKSEAAKPRQITVH